jgi:DNA-binding transcriptional MerR regulator
MVTGVTVTGGTVKGFTIAELAALSGMSSRNIRAYQSRGLLDPPLRHGRVAYYGAHHVARLALIRALQLQGFSLEAIRHLVDNPASYAAMAADARPPSTDWDLPASVPLGAEVDLLRSIRASLPEAMAALGLLVRTADGGYATAPVLAGVGARLLRTGVPADLIALSLVQVGEAAAATARTVAARMHEVVPPEHAAAQDRLNPDQVLGIVVQLLAAGFEVAFAHAVAEAAPVRR